MIDNLNNYIIFHTVAKCGNISRAAKELFISQPAISKSILKLEAELGTTLFHRNSRGVSLTEQGHLLYEYVERALDNLDQGEENVRKYSETGMGHIRIGVSTSLCRYVLIDYLKDFIKENPNIRISIDCHSTINTINLLKNDSIDIGLICNTDLPKGLNYHPVKEIHDIFVANYDYIDSFLSSHNDESANTPVENMLMGSIGAFLGAPDQSTMQTPARNTMSKIYATDNAANIPVIKTPFNMDGDDTLSLLEESNLLVLEEGNVTRQHVDRYMMEHKIKASQLLEINNMDLLVDFASIGMGVASVVREFALDALNEGKIIELPLPTEIEKRTVGFSFHGGKKMSTALVKFLEYCKAQE